ncbi:hypothetical protein J6590_061706 [Homalodisca vitripennis]|nr:hypothetical protein J6590_061706 [Homalodisca vitripennis]
MSRSNVHKSFLVLCPKLRKQLGGLNKLLLDSEKMSGYSVDRTVFSTSWKRVHAGRNYRSLFGLDTCDPVVSPPPLPELEKDAAKNRY